MIKLFIIADDFTGALDTGVKFAHKGASVKVVTDYDYDFEKCDGKIEVLVMDAETRHVSAAEAYRRVYGAIKRASDRGVSYIFKKTDSALRGNIGSELEAALAATGRKTLHFLPSMPQIGRVVQNGILYINGVPVNESMFGSDPFEPVYCSDVSDIIALQSKIPSKGYTEVPEKIPDGIVVYDSETVDDLKRIANELNKKDTLRLMAGCAGLAEMLPELLGIGNDKAATKEDGYPKLVDNLIVACGSVNPITRKQLDVAEKQGFKHIYLSTEQKLEEGYAETEQGKQELADIYEICKSQKWVILDTNDPESNGETLRYCKTHNIDKETMRVRISTSLGRLIEYIVDKKLESTFLITGGDCLLGFMNRIGVHELTPISELGQGAVLSACEISGTTYYIFSKSGGFGKEDIICELRNRIENKNQYDK